MLNCVLSAERLDRRAHLCVATHKCLLIVRFGCVCFLKVCLFVCLFLMTDGCVYALEEYISVW